MPLIRTDRINLQVALDFGDTPTLLRAAELIQAEADWLEAGTPWLIAEGVAAVRELRRAFPEHVLVADLKIVDAGGLEAPLGFAAGANIVSVLGLASDQTIRDAVLAAHDCGGRVMVDLLQVADPAGRAVALLEMGADYIGVHAGHDEIKSGRGGHGGLAQVSAIAGRATVVGGGIGPDNLEALCRQRPGAVIVGRAITQAPDPLAAARQIRRILERSSREELA